MGILTRISRSIETGIKGFSWGFSEHYEGASLSGNNQIPINGRAQDYEFDLDPWTRENLITVARVLYDNVGFIHGAINENARHTVGEGIIPISDADDAGIALDHDDYWTTWCDIPELTQQWDFRKVLEITSKGVDVDGVVGFLLTETATGYPQIQAIPAHRIKSPPGDESFTDGVKLNAVGRPVAYSIRSVGLEGWTYKIIPASSFVLVADVDRFGGVISPSALTPAIINMRDKKDILTYEKLGVKIGSALGIKLKTAQASQTGKALFGSPETVVDSSGAAKTFEKISGGAIVELGQGDELETFSSNRPSAAFTGFLAYLDRDVAAGLDLPVEFIWDPAALGGTSQRFIMVKAQKRFEERQRMLKRSIKAIRNYVIAKGIDRGDIKPVKGWWRVKWQMPSKISVDVGRESKANLEDYFAGLRTLQEDFGERGIDWKVARNDQETAARDLLGRAAAIRKDFPDLTLQDAINLIEKRGNTGSPPSGSNNGSGQNMQDNTKKTGGK